METYDPAKAARVWQRVQGNIQPEQTAHDLLELIQEEWTDAAIYLQLSRLLKGSQSVMLRQMFQQEQAHAACLKGIYSLITGTHPNVRTPAVTPSAPEIMLRRCYGREMRCLARYESRASDPEYGKVFSRLALQEQDHCRQILEILGNLKK